MNIIAPCRVGDPIDPLTVYLSETRLSEFF